MRSCATTLRTKGLNRNVMTAAGGVARLRSGYCRSGHAHTHTDTHEQHESKTERVQHDTKYDTPRLERIIKLIVHPPIRPSVCLSVRPAVHPSTRVVQPLRALSLWRRSHTANNQSHSQFKLLSHQRWTHSLTSSQESATCLLMSQHLELPHLHSLGCLKGSRMRRNTQRTQLHGRNHHYYFPWRHFTDNSADAVTVQFLHKKKQTVQPSSDV